MIKKYMGSLEKVQGERVLLRETAGALMQKHHDEGVRVNLNRWIEIGWLRLEGRRERKNGPRVDFVKSQGSL